MNKSTNKNSKGFLLEVHLEYPKELLELHNDKIDIKRQMFSIKDFWFLQYFYCQCQSA